MRLFQKTALDITIYGFKKAANTACSVHPAKCARASLVGLRLRGVRVFRCFRSLKLIPAKWRCLARLLLTQTIGLLIQI